MDQPHDSLPLRPPCFGGPLSRVRLQSAIVQALLDELMLRSTPASSEAALVEQLFDEVDRLQDAARSARAAIVARHGETEGAPPGVWTAAQAGHPPRRSA